MQDQIELGDTLYDTTRDETVEVTDKEYVDGEDVWFLDGEGFTAQEINRAFCDGVLTQETP